MTIVTIASHTFRESIRKRILHVIIGISVLIIIVSLLIPVTDEPDARMKMILVVFFQVVVIFCITGIILLAATSLPCEIGDKTIFGILSKPVSRIQIITGKIIGFALLSVLVLATLSLLQIIVLQRTKAGLPEKYRGIVKARSEIAASRFHVQGKTHHVRGGIVWIEGGRTGIAVWNFSGLYNKPHGTSYFEMEFNPKTESTGRLAGTIPLVIRIENVDSGKQRMDVIPARADEPFLVKIAPEVLKHGCDIQISAFPLNKTDYIGITRDNVRLYLAKEGFLLNYGKAVTITFLKILLIMIIAVMGSTYLSAPVTIAVAFIIFICGHILDFIQDFSLLMHDHVHEHEHEHEHILSEMVEKPDIFLPYIDILVKKILGWFSIILPDFKRYDSLEFLLKGIDIPLGTVGLSFGYTALYAGVCLFISFLAFKRREFF